MDYHSILVPLALSPKPMGFLYPLNPWVWLATLISIPIFIITMWLLDFTYHGGYKTDWNSAVGFVLRVTTNQSSLEPFKKNLPEYKKLLILTWAFALFVILVSYAGTLTAMITKPSISRPINNIDEMLSQTEMKWLLETESGLYFYMLNSEEGSNMMMVYNRSKAADWGEIVSSVQNRTYIIPTVGIAIEEWTSQDFHDSGKCNFYTIGGKFLVASFSMALPGGRKYALIMKNMPIAFHCRREVRTLKT